MVIKKLDSRKGDPDVRRVAWGAWVCSAIFYLYEYFVRVIPSVMGTDLQQAFNANAATIGFACGLYYIVYGPLQLVVGPFYDRFGARKLLMGSIILILMGCFLAACPFPNIYLFCAGRLLMGVGSAFAFIGTIYVATVWFPSTKLAFLSGVTTALGMLGALLAQAPIARTVRLINWRNTWLLAGLLGFGCLFLAFRRLPPPPEWEMRRHAAHFNSKRNAFSQFIAGFLLVARNPQTWIIGVIACALFMPLVVFADFWGIQYIELIADATKSQASLANGMLYLGWLLGSPILGAISDHLSNRRNFLSYSCMFSTLLLLLLLLPAHLSLISVGGILFLLGIASSPEVICFIANVELNPPFLKATSVAMVNTIVMLFGGLMQPLCGLLIDFRSKIIPSISGGYVVEHYRFALLILPIATSVGLVLSFFMKEPADNS
ncbi:MAG: MFS transporter [Puniceicoccales bacterium]|jgi:MFS family permease|nr:MFS transporter [Puniceicoccales bacterium]